MQQTRNRFSVAARLPPELLDLVWRWWVVGAAEVSQHARIIALTYPPQLPERHGIILARVCRLLVAEGTLPPAPAVVRIDLGTFCSRLDGWLTHPTLLGAKLLRGCSGDGACAPLFGYDPTAILLEPRRDDYYCVSFGLKVGTSVRKGMTKLAEDPNTGPVLEALAWRHPFIVLEFLLSWPSGWDPSIRVAYFAPEGKASFTVGDLFRIALRFYSDAATLPEYKAILALIAANVSDNAKGCKDGDDEKYDDDDELCDFCYPKSGRPETRTFYGEPDGGGLTLADRAIWTHHDSLKYCDALAEADRTPGFVARESGQVWDDASRGVKIDPLAVVVGCRKRKAITWGNRMTHWCFDGFMPATRGMVKQAGYPYVHTLVWEPESM
jgi:hypothetical protein